MPKDSYDIQELIMQSGVPRRTVYFYVQQGVLPPPEGAGLAAHYNEDHLLRLRLIPMLRQQGLRLDEIRVRFTQLSGEEMRRMLSSSQPAPAAPRAVREPAIPEILGTPAGWGQQHFTHYTLPAGIALVAPENLSLVDRQRLNQLLQAARQIFSGSPVVYADANQAPAPKDTGGSQPSEEAGQGSPAAQNELRNASKRG
jgi:DNA-binding transcriptional MerR regulator